MDTSNPCSLITSLGLKTSKQTNVNIIRNKSHESGEGTLGKRVGWMGVAVILEREKDYNNHKPLTHV